MEIERYTESPGGYDRGEGWVVEAVFCPSTRSELTPPHVRQPKEGSFILHNKPPIMTEAGDHRT